MRCSPAAPWRRGTDGDPLSTRPPAPSTPSATLADGTPAHRADVVIIGAGVAGLATAVELLDRQPQMTVTVVDKGSPGHSGSSPWAQGGVAVAVGDDDSPDLHAADTIRAGDGLVDPVAAQVLARGGPGRIAALTRLGARFDTEPDGSLHLAREGGQSVARSVHQADATGAEMVRALRAALTGRVHRLAGPALRLDVEQGTVTGVWVILEDGPAYVRAGAVVLATGGCGGLFSSTTNPASATGDGLSLAWQAGAALRDLEFIQFHPTGLADQRPGSSATRLLLTEALRGAGATLHDGDGHRFLSDVHPDGELAPRHVVTRAITRLPGRVAWLDATGLGAARLAAEFPTALNGARRRGFDIAAQRVPITPVAHYHVGGVRTDLDGRTSLPGLSAVGEVASTGVHGANRMAGNSLSETLVFGARAASTLAAELPSGHGALGREPTIGSSCPLDEAPARARLRSRMWTDAGPARDGGRLAVLAAELRELARELGAPTLEPAVVELHHAARAAAVIVRGARLRTESRGGHRRADAPDADPAWQGAHIEQTGPVDG